MAAQQNFKQEVFSIILGEYIAVCAFSSSFRIFRLFEKYTIQLN